ncbi:hypothetical protein SLE2022_395260 [Rubroshorea leprosula]
MATPSILARQQWIHGFAVNIGSQSSYMAELWGYRDGLQLAFELGVTHLILEMDSLMAIRMIQVKQTGEGSTSVLLSDIFHYLDTFIACTVQHTLREGNSAADFMAAIGHTLPQGLTLSDSTSRDQKYSSRDNIGTLFLKILPCLASYVPPPPQKKALD